MAEETSSASTHGESCPSRALWRDFWAIADLLLVRSPDDAKIKNKMLYASSKDALRRSLVGISTEIQGTDYSEVAHESGTCSFTSQYTSLLIYTSLVLEKASRGN